MWFCWLNCLRLRGIINATLLFWSTIKTSFMFHFWIINSHSRRSVSWIGIYTSTYTNSRCDKICVLMFHNNLNNVTVQFSSDYIEMCVLTTRLANAWSQIEQIWIISTHLKLCLATATHNFKWVEIFITNIGFKGLNLYIHNT